MASTQKAGGVFAALVFALCFGAVGVLATYAIVTMLVDSVRAKEWVRVKADVSEQTDTYRYRFRDQTYASSRQGLMPGGSTDNIDDWHDRMADHFAQARAEKRPISVYVNPDNPSEAVIDRDIRWGLVAFLVPFALCFGGGGVGALHFAFRVAKPVERRKGSRKGKGTRASAARPVVPAPSGLGGLWIFVFIWNAIAVPIALLVVPEAVRNGEWLALLVLIFPALGLLMFAGAVLSTVQRLVRSRPQFDMRTATPRLGAGLEGSAQFTRGVRAGDPFRVRLVCQRTSTSGDDTSVDSHWRKDLDVKAAPATNGVRVAFSFKPPAGLPPTTADEANPRYEWFVEVHPGTQDVTHPYRAKVEMLSAAGGSSARREPDRATLTSAR
jgi:hypothetical protein